MILKLLWLLATMNHKVLTQHKAVDIKYTKMVGGSGELNRLNESDRTIIPTILPTSTVKALDVTGLSKDDVAVLETRLKEYSDYYNAVANTIFSFDDWLELTYHQTGVKWRTFHQDGIDIKAD